MSLRMAIDFIDSVKIVSEPIQGCPCHALQRRSLDTYIERGRRTIRHARPQQLSVHGYLLYRQRQDYELTRDAHVTFSNEPEGQKKQEWRFHQI